MKEIRAQIIVKGLVQGVGFRYFVYNEAVKLQLKGYVKNLVTGEVEIEVEGDRSLVEEFIAIVRVGPRMAHVTDLAIEWRETRRGFSGFQIR